MKSTSTHYPGKSEAKGHAEQRAFHPIITNSCGPQVMGQTLSWVSPASQTSENGILGPGDSTFCKPLRSLNQCDINASRLLISLSTVIPARVLGRAGGNLRFRFLALPSLKSWGDPSR